jgi:fructose-specific phosphotransferase system IIA component
MNIFSKEMIYINTNIKNKRDFLKNMAKLAYENKKIENSKDFYNALKKRENISTTGVGFGIAIPHGKSKTVKEPFVAFTKLENEIEWKSLDEKPVNLIFTIGVPENSDNVHLKILQKLSIKLMDEDFREELKKTNDKEKLIKILKGIE